MGATIIAKASKNLTSLDKHLSRSYGERGTAARENQHFNAFASYVGAVVQEYRKEQSLTQQDLADRLGVKKSYLSRIENGHADIRLSTLARVLGAIGFDLVAMPQK